MILMHFGHLFYTKTDLKSRTHHRMSNTPVYSSVELVSVLRIQVKTFHNDIIAKNLSKK